MAWKKINYSLKIFKNPMTLKEVITEPPKKENPYTDVTKY